GDRKAAQPLAPVAALAGEPVGTLLDDVAHPAEGLDVVAQGRAAKEPDLGREGWSLARQSALALNAFEHRRFFAADIGAGATAEMDLCVWRQVGGLDCGDLPVEDGAALRVFVTQIDVNVSRLDHPSRDQHPFEKPMRIGLEKIAVLESARLAFVAIDCQ